jgi:hypothetical protein
MTLGRPAAVAATLTAASLPALAGQARRERDRHVFWVLLAAEQLRFAVAIAHLRVLEREYPGITDQEEWDAAGRAIAGHLRAGRLDAAWEAMLTVPAPTGLPGPTGTNLMRLLAGVVQAVVGPDRRSHFLVFSWLGFWGLLAFHRAFVLAVPGGRRRGYRRLLFGLPSLAFHTSSVGKESWMALSLGVGALGGAQALTGARWRGMALAAVGGGLAAAMRAQVGGRTGVTVGSQLRHAGARSSFGGSAFAPRPIAGPSDVPVVAATVLFRPHPLEANNPQALAAALEGAFLAALTAARARWLLTAALDRRRPYAGFSLAVAAVLTAYLSRVANFGMLVRQRAALLPFYLVALCTPPRR